MYVCRFIYDLNPLFNDDQIHILDVVSLISLRKKIAGGKGTKCSSLFYENFD